MACVNAIKTGSKLIQPTGDFGRLITSETDFKINKMFIELHPRLNDGLGPASERRSDDPESSSEMEEMYMLPSNIVQSGVAPAATTTKRPNNYKLKLQVTEFKEIVFLSLQTDIEKGL